MKISQTQVEVVIFMQTSRIEGKLHLPSGGRLTDYLALAERKFVPITDASIYILPENRLLCSVPFVNVNKDFVIYIYPKDRE